MKSIEYTLYNLRRENARLLKVLFTGCITMAPDKRQRIKRRMVVIQRRINELEQQEGSHAANLH